MSTNPQTSGPTWPYGRTHLKGPFRELNLKDPIRTSSFIKKLRLLEQALKTACCSALTLRGQRAHQSEKKKIGSNSNKFQKGGAFGLSHHRRVTFWIAAEGASVMLQLIQVQPTTFGIIGNNQPDLYGKKSVFFNHKVFFFCFIDSWFWNVDLWPNVFIIFMYHYEDILNKETVASIHPSKHEHINCVLVWGSYAFSVFFFFFSPHIGKHPLALLETVVIEIVAGLLQPSLCINNAVGNGGGTVACHQFLLSQLWLRWGWPRPAAVCVVLTAPQTDAAASPAPRRLTASTEKKDTRS